MAGNEETKKILEKIWGEKNILQFEILWLFFNQRDYKTNIERLAKKFKKSRHNIRRRVNELIKIGILARTEAGTIVIDKNSLQTKAIFDFFSEIREIAENTTDEEKKEIEKRSRMF